MRFVGDFLSQQIENLFVVVVVAVVIVVRSGVGRVEEGPICERRQLEGGEENKLIKIGGKKDPDRTEIPFLVCALSPVVVVILFDSSSLPFSVELAATEAGAGFPTSGHSSELL